MFESNSSLPFEPHHAPGLGKSVLIAGMLILMVTLGVVVMFSQQNTELRSRAAYPPVGELCNGNPKPTCLKSGEVAECRDQGWVCKVPTPTLPPQVTPAKLKSGADCGSDCYRACESGVGWSGKCRTRQAYCEAHKNPVMRAAYGLVTIECP